MEKLLNLIRDVLDPIGVVVGLIVTIPIFWTWWEITLGRKRRRKIWFDQVRRSTGSRPAILVIDLLPGKNIRTSVELFRKNHEFLKLVPDDRIFVVSRAKQLAPDDMPGLACDLRDVAANIIEAAVDTVHLFYAGPVVPPAMIGAELANTCRVMLYQHSQTDGYVNWGPLRHIL